MIYLAIFILIMLAIFISYVRMGIKKDELIKQSYENKHWYDRRGGL